jgi:hypothetical protein
MELIRPRFAIESAERTKFETKSGQNREDIRSGCDVDADELLWKYRAMPISFVALENNLETKDGVESKVAMPVSSSDCAYII